MRPTRKSALVLVGAAVVLFILSASGQADSYWVNGPSWIGTIGWFGFLICAVLLIVSGLFAAISWMRHRDGISTP